MNEAAPYLERYRQGEWRATIFRDLILADAARRPGELTFLDIGCGRGFDDDLPLQQSLAARAHRYIGVEPDAAMAVGAHVSEVHRCLFEDALIPSGSIDVAFAVMVLEHLPQPARFWDKLFDVLKSGGCFWGFTVDGRHWFCRMSRLLEQLRLKDLYLNLLLGRRGPKRYENYPTFYRSNSPPQVLPLVQRFARADFINFARIGQGDYYFPRPFRPLARCLDRWALARGRPGTLLAIRVEK